MTLNVTVGAPNGIVIASDSLASTLRPFSAQVDVEATCPSCTEPLPKQRISSPPIPIAANSSPLAQKLFWVGQYGVAFFGAAAVGGRTVCNHVLNYVHTTFAQEPGKSVNQVAEDLYNILLDALSKEPGFDSAPDDFAPIGFQIAGYNENDLDQGTRLIVHVSKQKQFASPAGAVSLTGQDAAVKQLYRHSCKLASPILS